MCSTSIRADIYKTIAIEIRNQPSHKGSIDFQQDCQDHLVGKGQSFQQLMLGKLDIHMQKNKVIRLPYIIH